MGDGYAPPTLNILQTERLVLRRLTPADIEALLDVLGDPVAMEQCLHWTDRASLSDPPIAERAEKAPSGP
jgi:RimJ/RimL family protein N-acetyltransferase